MPLPVHVRTHLRPMTFQSLKREGSEEAKRPAEQSEEQYYDDDAFDVTEFGQGERALLPFCG